MTNSSKHFRSLGTVNESDNLFMAMQICISSLMAISFLTLNCHSSTPNLHNICFRPWPTLQAPTLQAPTHLTLSSIATIPLYRPRSSALLSSQFLQSYTPGGYSEYAPIILLLLQSAASVSLPSIAATALEVNVVQTCANISSSKSRLSVTAVEYGVTLTSSRSAVLSSRLFRSSSPPHSSLPRFT